MYTHIPSPVKFTSGIGTIQFDLWKIVRDKPLAPRSWSLNYALFTWHGDKSQYLDKRLCWNWTNMTHTSASPMFVRKLKNAIRPATGPSDQKGHLAREGKCCTNRLLTLQTRRHTTEIGLVDSGISFGSIFFPFFLLPNLIWPLCSERHVEGQANLRYRITGNFRLLKLEPSGFSSDAIYIDRNIKLNVLWRIRWQRRLRVNGWRFCRGYLVPHASNPRAVIGSKQGEHVLAH